MIDKESLIGNRDRSILLEYATPGPQEAAMHVFLRFGLTLGITALLGSANLAAQASHGAVEVTTQLNGTATPSQTAPAPTSCPVSMRAQQRAGGDTLVASNPEGRQTRVPASHIHLSLGKAKGTPAVAGARVTVFGTGGKARAVPAISGSNGSADAKKTLDLDLGKPDTQGVAAEVFVAGFTSVQSIRLDSLEFADGTVWTPAGGQVCRVAPDLMMLVSGR
jgi:hypothetical protein